MTQTTSDESKSPGNIGSDLHSGTLEQTLVRAFCGVLWTLTVALCTYLAFVIVSMVDPRVSAGADGHGTVVTLVLTIFAVLMTGIFVFMTFRIDRGARQEAATVAAQAADTIAVSQADKTAREVAATIAERAAIGAAEVHAKTTAQAVAVEAATVKATEVAVETAKAQAKLQAEATAREVAERMLGDMEQRVAEGVAEGVAQAFAQRDAPEE